MALTLIPHLNFAGQARRALEFYAGVFESSAEIRTYADVGKPADLPGADRVVWGLVASAHGPSLMAYDIPGAGPGDQAAPVVRRENGLTLTDQPFFLSLAARTLEEASVFWTRLADGATVVEPLAPSAFSAGFGMLTDRFGVTWTVTVG